MIPPILLSCQATVVECNLQEDVQGFAGVKAQFERANSNYHLDWYPQCLQFTADRPSVVFVQSGKAKVQVGEQQSECGVGDLFCLETGENLQFDSNMGLLVFGLPSSFEKDPPSIIRPDWDPNLTDSPGGCATEGDAYRRILLTWSGKNGPYLSRQLNAHRVRIHDSFTHYHPRDGGFDEFYLVQEAPPGARILVSDHLDAFFSPESVTTRQADELLREIPLEVGDLVYLPRGTVHRGVGGAVVQVITTPGFVPGAEIGVDEALKTMNRCLGLEGSDEIPFHRGPDFVKVQHGIDGSLEVTIGGKPMTTFRTDRRLPDLWPLRNSEGLSLARGFPRELIRGEKQDHPHHQGLWFAHGDIEGIDFWHDHQVSVSTEVLELESGNREGRWRTRHLWNGQEGDPLLSEERNWRVFVDGAVRGLDVELNLQALREDVTFGDTKEGSFALRVAKELVADQGGVLKNEEGLEGKEVWGKPSRWIQASGVLRGRKASIVIMDHPRNPRYPTNWHARTYGLLAANPFGQSAFRATRPAAGDITIPKGGFLSLRYRVLLFASHPSAEEVNRFIFQ
ncbi:MAG: PmoA family protein [Planctomycetes bacterium]|nr:PmoA family protein [Planctomycetota bacterium]